MDSSNGQHGPGAIRPRSRETRQRLLAAAAELIAAHGWGRVTTRAVAERAGLPHGAVSYHFRGKRELLTDAALTGIGDLFPLAAIEGLASVSDLIPLVTGWIANRDAMNPAMTGLMMEAMREAERNPDLRQHLVGLFQDYQRAVANLLRAEQHRGVIAADVSPDALATLIAAASDGLLLHALMNPDLNVAAAGDALLALLTAPGDSATHVTESAADRQYQRERRDLHD